MAVIRYQPNDIATLGLLHAGDDINVTDSIDRFDALLAARIRQTFPAAQVGPDAQMFRDFSVYGFGPDGSDDEAAQICRQIAGELYDDGNLWMVAAE